MAKNNIENLASQIDLAGRKVFVRVDLNVPLKGTEVTDDTRIRGVIPTVSFLMNKGAKVVLCSHLGRPKKGKKEPTMDPVVPKLSEYLGIQVIKANDTVGDEVKALVNGMSNGQVLLLENCRFYEGEEGNDPEFCRQLADLIDNDVYVNDAFGTAHRAHASTAGMAGLCNFKVAGYLMEKELRFLKGAVDNPNRPLAAIVGGAKVSTKITVIESMLEKCNKIVLGGGMTYTFFESTGVRRRNIAV